MRVEAEANPQIDFSKYTSFDVVDPTPNATGDPPPAFVDVQVDLNDAIIDELTNKGLYRDPHSPQLLVNPLVSVDSAAATASLYDAVYGWYWGYDHQWMADFDYEDDSLLIDVIDRGDPANAEDDVLVCRGIAIGLMAEDRDVIEARLREATQAIFDKWPK